MWRIAGMCSWSPLNSERKTGDQHYHGARIHRIHLLHQLFLLQRERLPVNGLFTVAWERTLRPTRITSWMITHYNNGDIGILRNLHRSVIRVVMREAYVDAAQFIFDSLECAHRITGRSAIPVESHDVSIWSDHRNRFQLRFVQRQKMFRVLQQHD